MAEKRDEAAGADTSAGWLDAVLGVLRAETERCVAALMEGEIQPDDMTGLDRRARAIANLARAARAVARKAAEPAAAAEQKEDGMDDTDRDHISQATDDELRAEFQSRLDRLRAQFEKKRRDAGLGPGDAYGGPEGDAQAA